MIAQDVQQVLPEIIDECIEKGEPYLGVRYTELIPLLIEGIKSQQVKIDLQQSQIDALMARVSSLENKM